jgi:hypothetical protein
MLKIAWIFIGNLGYIGLYSQIPLSVLSEVEVRDLPKGKIVALLQCKRENL